MAIQPKKEPSKAFKTASLGLLLAQAIALSYIEGLMPSFSFLPPGAKPGFSNIITMFTAAAVGLPEALIIAVLKSGFVLLTRGITAFIMSIAGGIASVIVMYILLRGQHGLILTGILGACTHNLAQLLVSSVIIGKVVFAYTPFLLLFAVAAGVITGLILRVLMPYLKHQFNFISRTGSKK
ncbi:MAG: Gx transporter family protein [Clostridia bacterium]|nr:Gx transporter family protein [Clostridia bacterium]